MTDSELTKLKILIVDDEEFVLNLSVRMLGRIGCQDVATAGDGHAALAKITSAARPYDIVITDLNMPDMDGVELLRHVAGLQFTGGIILLSGEDERILETALDLAQSHSLNVLGAMPKPPRPEALKELLGNFRSAPAKRRLGAQASLTVEELRAGLANGALLLAYQPKVHVQSGKITGVEALARWRHPERGVLGPAAFIPVAEDNGLIDALTRVVYEQAVRQARAWQTGGLNLHVSINVSVNSFLQSAFSDFLIETARHAGVESAMLTLEVTESQVMSNAMDCLEQMMHLRLKRFGLSIDDFGTGHSSLAQLKRVPFTELKVDRAFVYGAKHNASTRAILESSVDLGKKLKMTIVAEGVETRDDWDVVEGLSCDYVQGYFVAKPLPENELKQFVMNWSGVAQPAA